MTLILWREQWLKPLNVEDLNLDECHYCKKKFNEFDFVSSCEFCNINVVHDSCANDHLLKMHKKELKKKANEQKEKQLHEYQ